MDEFQKKLAEARAEYTRDLNRTRVGGRRVIGPGGGSSRKYIRGESNESGNYFHKFEQETLRRENERRSGKA